MRSKTLSLKIPWPLIDEMERVCVEEAYDNVNSCWIGAAIEKCQNNRRRRYVRAIANANPKDQSYLLEKLFEFPLEDIRAMIKYLEPLKGSRIKIFAKESWNAGT